MLYKISLWTVGQVNGGNKESTLRSFHIEVLDSLDSQSASALLLCKLLIWPQNGNCTLIVCSDTHDIHTPLPFVPWPH